jgi:signal transduction histidine kinase
MSRHGGSELDRLAATGLAAGYFAHEVGNLLTPAAAALETSLGQGSGREDLERAARLALDAITAAGEMSRLILGAVAPDRVRRSTRDGLPTADFRAAAESALRFLPASARSRVRIGVPAGTRVGVSQPILLQVLLNLLLNAAAAVGSGGHVHVRLADTQRGRPAPGVGSILVEVADTGSAGREEGTIGRMSRREIAAGDRAHGLGLAVCRHLLATEGGTLVLGANSAGGVTAALTLPRAGLAEAERKVA